jgi:uncharacterized protein YbjT (DUF2867 family)
LKLTILKNNFKKCGMNALILGASGLVGNELLELLLDDSRFDKIDLLSRRELDLRDVKVTNHVVDFYNLNKLPIHHTVDVLFIAFGTTLKKAGSQAKQFEIDVDIPTNVMNMAKERGVEKCVLVSALGVSKKSPFFYSRMKAQLDENAKNMQFRQLIILKPSVLEGFRPEQRRGENVSVYVGNILAKTGLIDSYRPVKAEDVAKAMIQTSIELAEGLHVISSLEIHQFAKKYTQSL